ncbi:type II toxin-antitoxin system MqsA family antitoxin [Methanolacinia paynteri]|uniref:type II toxin-antitoxin system MqsA family antitoxin n=1 Tax=Methanolacinia paynteri TaxID=230356 RepID=UPI00064FFF33|nr:type II toxin-antitoxin system MqsA family antitoxin [Methanolacinia paynteri]
MIPERCSYCKGNLKEGKTEFMVRVGEEVIIIRDIPAYICDQCGEVFFTPEISRKIDKIMEDAHKGRICCKPVAAGEVKLEV